jgi:putative peptide zinc metalloprotease protein
MTAPAHPLSSAQWHRVANWRPTLAQEVTVSRSWVRGQRWYVLHQWRLQQTCRLNDAAYAVAARMDGRTSLDDIWQALERLTSRQGEHAEAPSQDEIVAVVQQLTRQGMLDMTDQPTGPEPHIQTEVPQWQASSSQPNSLLSWRMALGNPHAWLVRREHWAQAMFSSAGLVLWGLAMVALLAGLLLHHKPLLEHAQTWLNTPHYWWLSLLVYPAIKTCHELGHALAITRWGGGVREFGINWMMGMPIPYVNASAAHGFPHPWQRAVVAGAGIGVELVLAAAGLWIWHWSQPGFLADLAFITWFIACASTLLFNANPLQRLDGYHLFTELLHLPNLATRSALQWQHRLQSWLAAGQCPADQLNMAPPARGEHLWLWLYAPLAWCCQALIWSGLCWWLGTHSSVMAAALAVLCAYTLAIKPVYRLASWAWTHTLMHEAHTVHWWQTTAGRGGLVLAALLLALLMPWPDRILVQGVVWAPEAALIRSDVDGVVTAVHARDGQKVKAGDLLLTLHNPQLQARRDQVAAQLAQAEQSQYTHLGRESDKAGQADDDATRLSAELARLDEQLAQLQVRARQDGQLVWPHADDLAGLYARRGQLLGQVLGAALPSVKVAVAQADAPQWKQATQQVRTPGISLRLRAPGSQPVQAELVRDALGATQQLPSPALSRDFGGDVPTDPKDDEHLRTIGAVVLMDIQALAPLAADHAVRLGERVWVRLDQGWAPPAWQWWRWVSRRVLLDLSPAT